MTLFRQGASSATFAARLSLGPRGYRIATTGRLPDKLTGRNICDSFSPAASPQEAKAALAQAIDKLLADQELLAKAAEAAEGYQFVTGADLAAAVEAVVNMPDDNVAWFRDFLSQEFDVQFAEN